MGKHTVGKIRKPNLNKLQAPPAPENIRSLFTRGKLSGHAGDADQYDPRWQQHFPECFEPVFFLSGTGKAIEARLNEINGAIRENKPWGEISRLASAFESEFAEIIDALNHLCYIEKYAEYNDTEKSKGYPNSAVFLRAEYTRLLVSLGQLTVLNELNPEVAKENIETACADIAEFTTPDVTNPHSGAITRFFEYERTLAQARLEISDFQEEQNQDAVAEESDIGSRAFAESKNAECFDPPIAALPDKHATAQAQKKTSSGIWNWIKAKFFALTAYFYSTPTQHPSSTAALFGDKLPPAQAPDGTVDDNESSVLAADTEDDMTLDEIAEKLQENSEAENEDSVCIGNDMADDETLSEIEKAFDEEATDDESYDSRSFLSVLR